MSCFLSRQNIGQFTAYHLYLPFIIIIGNIVYNIWIISLYPLFLIYKQTKNI